MSLCCRLCSPPSPSPKPQVTRRASHDQPEMRYRLLSHSRIHTYAAFTAPLKQSSSFDDALCHFRIVALAGIHVWPRTRGHKVLDTGWAAQQRSNIATPRPSGHAPAALVKSKLREVLPGLSWCLWSCPCGCSSTITLAFGFEGLIAYLPRYLG
ncbi:hypothetical protein BS50DRAFT_350424 [Corynespora cassiicola Philippines]|uniref:Uncharacterized protein n=1 Tax=Corynespora cassiicola Philippines TaxID=1448308 RepID=A0A2T2NRE2_CORCC|nr:hypothetical protein BS50DRAFT_350424 [Corynespora cassiicola Philippines]